VRWMTSLTPLVVSSMGPPVIGCTLFFHTGTSCWRRRSSRPPPSASPLPPTLAFRAAAPMAGRPAAPWAAAVAALLGSAGRASGRRPRRRSHGRPATPQAAAAASPCYAPSPTLRCRHSRRRRARHRRPSVVGAASSAQIQPGPCCSSLLPTESPHCRLPQAPPAPRSRLRPPSALPLPWPDAEPLPVLHSPSRLGSPRCPRRCSARPPTASSTPRCPTSTPRRSTPAIGRHAT